MKRKRVKASQSMSSSSRAKKRSRPCRFYLMDSCSRAICNFLHDDGIRSALLEEAAPLLLLPPIVPLQSTVFEQSSSSGHDSDLPSIHWPLHPCPSSAEELQLKPYLILSPKESGRGIHLSHIRRSVIRVEAERRSFNYCGAMSYRRQLIRQLTTSSHEYLGQRNMGSNSEAENHATRFEVICHSYLRDRSIFVMTQDDLKQTGVTSTPDFYFPRGVVINGQIVNWLDCKTFYGSSSLAERCFVYKKVSRQISKYTAAYGRGAVLFLCGFSSDLRLKRGFDDVLLLNSGPLDVASLWAEDPPTAVVVDSHMANESSFPCFQPTEQ